MGFEFIDELTRQLKDSGVVINEQGGNLTQLLTNTTHIQNIVKPKFISDRCILDSMVYTSWLYSEKKIDHWVYNFAKNSFKMLIDQYDYIFYLKPEFDLVDDGVRSSDVEFRNKISDLFEYYIDNYLVDVHTLTGTVEQRFKQFKDVIWK